jgi:hypothetical protein
MKRAVFVICLFALILTIPIAATAKSTSGKGLMSDNFQAGVDFGAYLYGIIPSATATFKDQSGQDLKTDLTGDGGFGPLFGLHFNMLLAKPWILHLDMAYSYQSGVARFKFDKKDVDAGYIKNEKENLDYGLEMFHGSVGVGKSIIATSIVNPYWLLGLSAHHMAFQEKDADEAATGTGLGPFGALGVDAKITRMKGLTFFGGGQFRLDIMYSVTPLVRNKTEITMAYIPLSLILSGGIQF